jgi:hypothetical protein
MSFSGQKPPEQAEQNGTPVFTGVPEFLASEPNGTKRNKTPFQNKLRNKTEQIDPLLEHNYFFKILYIRELQSKEFCSACSVRNGCPGKTKIKKFFFMDYIDRVYVDLKDREKSNFLMSNLKDPEKFISAVKFLIDGGWITNVHWDSSYSTLFIEEKLPGKKPRDQDQNRSTTTGSDNESQ